MTQSQLNRRSLTVHLDEGTYLSLVEQASSDGHRSLSSVVRTVLAHGLRSQDARIRPGGSAAPFEAGR